MGGCKGLVQLLEQCSNSKQASSSGSASTFTTKTPLLTVSSASDVAVGLPSTDRPNILAAFQGLAQDSSAFSRNTNITRMICSLHICTCTCCSVCVYRSRAPTRTPSFDRCLFSPCRGGHGSYAQAASSSCCAVRCGLRHCCSTVGTSHSTAAAADTLGRSHLTSLVAQDETAN